MNAALTETGKYCKSKRDLSSAFFYSCAKETLKTGQENVTRFKRAFQDNENKGKQQPAFPYLKRRKRRFSHVRGRGGGGRGGAWIQIPITIYRADDVAALSHLFSSSFSLTEKYSLPPQGRSGREARLFQVGAVFLRLGSEMRGGRG